MVFEILFKVPLNALWQVIVVLIVYIFGLTFPHTKVLINWLFLIVKKKNNSKIWIS